MPPPLSPSPLYYIWRLKSIDYCDVSSVVGRFDLGARTTTGLNVRDSITTEPQHYKDHLITSMHRKQGKTSKGNTKHATP